MRGPNKYIVVLLSAIFAIGAIMIGMKYSSSKIPKDTTVSSGVVDNSTRLTVNDLFQDQSQVFLAEDITDSYIVKVKETIDESNTEELNLLNIAVEKWAIQKQLNQLFTAPALIGSQIAETPTLVTGVTEADKQKVLTALSSSGLTDGFATAVQSILSSGTSSSSVGTGDGAVARELLSHLVVDGAIQPDFTLETYNNARDAVAVLPLGDERKELAAQIKLVETAMTQMGVTFEPLEPAY